MRSSLLTVLLIALATCALTACEPIGPVPGADLSGQVSDVPDDWSQTADVDVFQLETSPTDPYSVNIWGVAIDDDFYIAAGDNGDTRWAASLMEDAKVRLRVGEAIYEMTAELVADPNEKTAARAAYIAKYELDPETVPVDQFALYRLDPRGP